ncbi:MAG: cysteine synthase [Chloroflexi bacterium]|nr:cysteine synthase [Chloroflexota bacterium]
MQSKHNNYNTALDTIGNTPIIKLQNIVPPNHANVYAKLESYNPTGSKKDRMALAMIEGAEERGELSTGMTVVEYTGGSTGSALAFVCAVKGYKFHVISSDAFGREKLDTMRALGAKLEVIKSQDGKITPDLINQMIQRASEIARKPDTFFTNQLSNPDIIRGFEKMGHEIIEQIAEPIDGFCDSIGTAGSLMGVSRSLKTAGQDTLVIALEPSTSPILTMGTTGGHNIEGVGLGFIPELLDNKYYDHARTVDENEARRTARKLAREEGIFVGTSSGMNIAGAIKLAKDLGPDKTVVAIACDTGLKYLSEGLFS